MRILWISSFFISSGFCFYSCTATVQIYYSYNSFNKITEIQEIPSQFPTISLCNFKLLNQSNPETLKFLDDNKDVTSDFNGLRTSFAIDKNLSTEDRKQIGFLIENMLRVCVFNNQICYPNIFTYFYSPVYANCYSFNSGIWITMELNLLFEKYLQMLDCMAYGLKLMLVLIQPKHILMIDQDL